MHVRVLRARRGSRMGPVREGSGVLRKRRWARLRRRFKVTFGQNAAAFTVDVCGGGFCAQLLRAVSPGALVEGTILANGRVHSYAGLVAWAKAGDVRLGIPGRIGVGFTNVESTFPGLLGSGTVEAVHGRALETAEARQAAP